MADKKLNEVTKVTDMAYVPVIMADGSIGQIAKADLASVVAGNMELNKNVYLLLEKGIVTSTGITKEGYYMVKFEGEPDTCFFTFKPGNVNILTNAWFTTNNSLIFSHNNGILNVVYADGTARIIITRI